jgi:hypothetical protein
MKVYNRNAGGKKHKTEEFVSRIYLPQSSLRAGHQWLKPEILKYSIKKNTKYFLVFIFEYLVLKY